MEIKIKGDWYNMVLLEGAIAQHLRLYQQEALNDNPLATKEKIEFLANMQVQVEEQFAEYHRS